MYNYIGNKCPKCGIVFTESDDIVVCPDCGAPYHRSCCTVPFHCELEAKHSASFEWEPDIAPTNSDKAELCKRCGKPIPTGSRFCMHCGAETASATAPDSASTPSDTLLDIPIAEWETFIGRSSNLYLHVFSQMHQTGRRISVNFSALVFGPLYFVYRKMWGWGIFFTVLELIMDAPFMLYTLAASGSAVLAGADITTLGTLANVCSIVSWVIMFFRGLYGNYLYLKSGTQKIKFVNENVTDPAEREEVLEALGGVSMKGVVMFFALMFLASSLLMSALGADAATLYRAFYS